MCTIGMTNLRGGGVSSDIVDDSGFLDEAHISVRAGSGGDGVSHFRREKYVPRGGPDGGDGGRGGDVILRARSNLHALTAFRHKRHFNASDGRPGEGQRRHGSDGAGLIVDVPCGTVAYDVLTGAVIADLVTEDETAMLARGGHGGSGNARFKSARFQAPKIATRGDKGEERRVRLELELIADVGLVGAPNAGKSSLLTRLSAARPKVASYPFTTLDPVLGVVEIGDSGLVFADLPGLIDGASQGAGLGGKFLRHVRRARVLIQLVDASGLEGDPFETFKSIEAELASFDATLVQRPRIVVFNKMDIVEARDRWPDLRARVRSVGHEPLAISVATGEGLDALLRCTVDHLTDAPLPSRREETSMPVLRPDPVDEGPQIYRRSDGAYIVRDNQLERLARSLNFDTVDAAAYFQRQLDRRGVTERLERAGTVAGDTVIVGDLEFDWDGPQL